MLESVPQCVRLVQFLVPKAQLVIETPNAMAAEQKVQHKKVQRMRCMQRHEHSIVLYVL